MEGFKKSTKMQCFKEGGHVKYESRKEHKEEMAADIAQDKKIIKKAFKMHDTQEHKGERTDLSKLKKGGRAKKEAGSVRKYKCGGAVENAYSAKKSDKDIKDIASTKRQKPQMLCGGKSVKAYQAGSLVENVMGTKAQNDAASKSEAKYLAAKELERAAGKPMGLGEKLAMGLARIGQRLQPAPTNVGAPAGSTVPGGQKRGGKVKRGCK